MDKTQARRLLQTYGEAWITQNPDLIVSIFTDDATYDDPHEPINIGKDAIRQYWNKKVVSEQKDISFNLKNVWVEDKTVIAEWEASFFAIKQNTQVNLREIAVLTIRDGKFSSLREYYNG